MTESAQHFQSFSVLSMGAQIHVVKSKPFRYFTDHFPSVPVCCHELAPQGERSFGNSPNSDLDVLTCTMNPQRRNIDGPKIHPVYTFSSSFSSSSSFIAPACTTSYHIPSVAEVVATCAAHAPPAPPPLPCNTKAKAIVLGSASKAGFAPPPPPPQQVLARTSATHCWPALWATKTDTRLCQIGLIYGCPQWREEWPTRAPAGRTLEVSYPIPGPKDAIGIWSTPLIYPNWTTSAQTHTHKHICAFLYVCWPVLTNAMSCFNTAVHFLVPYCEGPSIHIFDTFTDFTKWKEGYEAATNTQFVLTTKGKALKDGKTTWHMEKMYLTETIHVAYKKVEHFARALMSISSSMYIVP